MNIVFISNFFNHHQMSLCDAFDRLTNHNFYFIATGKISQERLALGWGKEHGRNYVHSFNDDLEDEDKYKKIISNADVVIYGAVGKANFDIIKPRLNIKKLTYRYSERIYKKGCPWYRIPFEYCKQWLVAGRYSSLYLLAASAYAAADYAKVHCFNKKAFKWGYFPRPQKYDLADLMSRKLSVTSGWKHPKVSILWAGRLIGLKHPDVSIKVAERLKNEGYPFIMNIIGSGEMEQQLHTMIEEKGLSDCVEMLGTMSPESVREHMEKADIFLFTSDFNEGWGAVLNESMNSGCAVVASHAIGSVPFLLKDGENGFIYQNGNFEDLYQKVTSLINNPQNRRELGKEAYLTVANLWNADVAAERLIALSKNIMDGNPNPELYSDGPCSEAVVLKNGWYN